MTGNDFLFWGISILTLLSGLFVITLANPVFSALFLALTMIGIAGLFVLLDALFLAGVQMIVYAGAVVVLFVMVLMLFDLKQELKSFSKGVFSAFVKLLSVGLLTGLIAGGVWTSGALFDAVKVGQIQGDVTAKLGELLFTKYVVEFEVLGVLLLIVAVGTVALARSEGGTHDRR